MSWLVRMQVQQAAEHLLSGSHKQCLLSLAAASASHMHPPGLSL